MFKFLILVIIFVFAVFIYMAYKFLNNPGSFFISGVEIIPENEDPIKEALHDAIDELSKGCDCKKRKSGKNALIAKSGCDIQPCQYDTATLLPELMECFNVSMDEYYISRTAVVGNLNFNDLQLEDDQSHTKEENFMWPELKINEIMVWVWESNCNTHLFYPWNGNGTSAQLGLGRLTNKQNIPIIIYEPEINVNKWIGFVLTRR